MAVVLDALASYVQNMLTEMVKEELHMLLGVTGDIRNMETKLKDLKSFLADADRKSITDQRVQALVGELRVAMYSATDIIDLCQLKAMEEAGRPSWDLGCFNPLLFCMRNPLHAHDIGKRIKNLNQRLAEIKERSSSLGFIDLSSYEDSGRRVVSTHPHSHSPETSENLDESRLVGEKIEEDTRNMVEMLTKEEVTYYEGNKIVVFAIVGVGGIGKTTLAQKIFNHEIIQREFTKTIWLSVNQDYSETGLLKNAITEAGGGYNTAGTTKGALERTLKAALNGHKTLLVMDDVWNPKAWEGVLRTPLVTAAATGSRVLVTTRHDKVARAMKAVEPYYHVHKLMPEDAWSLLKKKVVINVYDEPQIEMLKDIGMGIIEKCDGLPLAVKVMGGLLLHKRATPCDWEDVLHSSIWPVSQETEELNYAIYLSYEDLNPCLKSCFLHYSLLPRSTVCHLDDIVGMWISEGLVQENSGDQEKLGREYFEELIRRNLIEPDGAFADEQVCNMHDVIRSFARYVAREEALVVQNSSIDNTGKPSSEKVIRLSLESNATESNELLDWSSLQVHISLRTLISAGHIEIKPGDSLLSFPSLRTLHIEHADFDALAESLDQLKHLRYLSLQYTSTSRLPETIGEMKFLEYISLFCSKRLQSLPSSILNLEQLRFLSLRGTSIKTVPRGLGVLTNLRKLYGFPSHIDGEWCSLEELGPLSKLIRLEITGLHNVSSSSFSKKARLDEKKCLSYLFLCCIKRLPFGGSATVAEIRRTEEVFDELRPPPSLVNLELTFYFGQRLPMWMTSKSVTPLENLRILTLEELYYCKELPDGLSQLPFLELLQIDRAPYIKRVGPEFLQPCDQRHSHFQVVPAFPRLRKISFIGMNQWEEWKWEEQVQAMPTLVDLRLKRCRLRHLPPGLASQARALKELRVHDAWQLSSLENFASVIYLEVHKNPEMERICNFPKLKKLSISMCPKLKVLEGMPELQTLELEDYDMKTLPMYLMDVNPSYLQLCCRLSLLEIMAAGEVIVEWEKIEHIRQVKAFANSDEGIPRKFYVLCTRDPFSLKINVSSSALITKVHTECMIYGYLMTCPIEDEQSSDAYGANARENSDNMWIVHLPMDGCRCIDCLSTTSGYFSEDEEE